MKTPEQLKGAIRSIAASRNLRSKDCLLYTSPSPRDTR